MPDAVFVRLAVWLVWDDRSEKEVGAFLDNPKYAVTDLWYGWVRLGEMAVPTLCEPYRG